MLYKVINIEDNLYRIDRVSSYYMNRTGKYFNSYIDAETYVNNNGYLYSNQKLKEKRRPFSKSKNYKNIW